MISRIVFHLGDYSTTSLIQTFCTRNEEALAKQNIIYPEHIIKTFSLPPRSTPASGGAYCRNHDFLNYLFLPRGDQKVDLPEGSSTLRDVCLRYLNTLIECYQHDDREYTLCFSWPNYLYFLTQNIQCTHWPLFFKTLFKVESVEYILFLSDQASLLQGMTSYASIINHGYIPTSAEIISYNANYDMIINNLNHNFKKQNKIVITEHNAEKDAYALDAFIKFMHIESIDTLDMTPPLIRHPLPRDVLGFLDIANRTMYGILPSDTPADICWPEESLFLTSGTDPLPFLSPEEYKYLHATYEDSNAKLAKRLGFQPGYLTPSTPPEKWHPSAKLSMERARFFLSRLSPQVREVLNGKLHAYPEHKTWYGPRVLQKALTGGDVHTKIRATVAVLTLAYNHDKYIEKNIQSVIEQKTDFPVEHIIVDDGSTDATQKIILHYAARYPHITPVLRDISFNNAPGSSPRRLFDMASTEFVALCDGDDYFCDTHKLQKQYTFLRNNPRYSVCFHPVFMMWEETPERNCLFPLARDLPPHKQPYNLTDLARWNFMSTSSVMYRWRFREGLPYWFYEKALPGDWYWHMLHAEVGRIGMLDEPMSVYRRHSTGIWQYAETNLVKHKEKHGVKELSTYIAIDRHFDGRFRNIFTEHILWEFSFLYKIATEDGISEPFQNAVRRFPEWARIVLEKIQTTRTIKDSNEGGRDTGSSG